MIFPSLVKEEFCKTPIKVIIESEEIDEDGNPQTFEYEGFCNYQSSSKVIYKDDKKVVQLSGKCYLPGDIFPDLDLIPSGNVILNNNNILRNLYRGSKNYNPDGTTNYTMLELS